MFSSPSRPMAGDDVMDFLVGEMKRPVVLPPLAKSASTTVAPKTPVLPSTVKILPCTVKNLPCNRHLSVGISTWSVVASMNVVLKTLILEITVKILSLP